VKLSEVEPFSGNEAAPNALMITGGKVTVMEALEVLLWTLPLRLLGRYCLHGRRGAGDVHAEKCRGCAGQSRAGED